MGNRLSAGIGFAVGLVVGVGVGMPIGEALAGDDDRPPIIVRNGSVIFDGGDPKGDPKTWKAWKKDILGEQWKPDHDNGRKVREYQVSYSGFSNPPACTTTTTSGQEVLVDYTTSGGTVTMKMYIQVKIGFPGFGKREPKIDSSPNVLTMTPGTSTSPPDLSFGNPNEGYVSKVTVDSQPCNLGAPGSDDERKARKITVYPKD